MPINTTHKWIAREQSGCVQDHSGYRIPEVTHLRNHALTTTCVCVFIID